MTALEHKTTARLDQLFLSVDNPRHDPVKNESEAIDLLCKTENIAELARDISRNGISPAERLIVYPAKEGLSVSDLNDNTSYIVAEGNRRVCALKILFDPDKAPSPMRDSLHRQRLNFAVPESVDVVVIFDEERRTHWLERMHDGPQGGIGRKPWNAEQKTRFNGSRRNQIAQTLLDYSEKIGLLLPAQRKGLFSHMARLVGNPLIAEALGLNYSLGAKDLQRFKPKSDFDLLLGVIIEEAREKNLGSQATKTKIDNFARELLKLPDLSHETIEPVRIEIEPNPVIQAEIIKVFPTNEKQIRSRPTSPKQPEHISHEPIVANELEARSLVKLAHLYYSLCSVNAKQHTPLVAMGAWGLFEILTALMGRKENTAFKDYLNRSKLTALGLGDKKVLNAPILALGRISDYGNVTKHHSVSAQFDYRQLINDFETLTPLLTACIKNINHG